MSGPDLAALVGSRLCHDLVSPLGAIGNGVELLKMLHDGSDELGLIEQAVMAAQARVRLFRLAFGAATERQEVRAADLAEALGAVALGGRIAVEAAPAGPLSRPRAKRLALATLCAESALAWGGTIRIAADGLAAEAARLKLDPALWAPLETGGSPEGLTAATVHFGLLAASGPVSVIRTAAGVAIRL